MISKQLLEILACPKCKNKVNYDKRSFLVCSACRLRFPIKGDIPDMLNPKKF